MGDGDYVRKVGYENQPFQIYDAFLRYSADYNLPFLLSNKSSHWSYEEEWRLIVQLNRTIGTGKTDQHDQPINLIQIPNEAVVRVYYTERTPCKKVELIRKRLADKNNRYREVEPRKLAMSYASFGYEEAPDDQQS